MTKQEADEKIQMIHRLAEEIENDEELLKLDERYSVAASFCDCDISTVSLC